MIWAFGGPLEKDKRNDFTKWWKKEQMFQHVKICDENTTLFDYFLETREMKEIKAEEAALAALAAEKGKKNTDKKKDDKEEEDLKYKWRLWSVRVGQYVVDPDVPFAASPCRQSTPHV